MKLLSSALFILLVCTSLVKSDVIYLDPIPNAKFVSIHNNIVIGLDEAINISSLDNIKLIVTGSKSGAHTGEMKLTTDRKRILFLPSNQFMLDEAVTVNINSTNGLIKYNSSVSFSYSFKTELSNKSISSDQILRSELGENYRAPFSLDSQDPPQVTVTFSNNPSPGKLFLASYNQDPSYMLIIENNGDIYFDRTTGSQILDFKKHPNGTLTYFNAGLQKFFQLNDSYKVIDSFACGNGYITDVHELILLPNNHALLMAYDPQTVDMSQIVPGGNPAANVIGLIIQELDENKNVVFQWRSWDHFEITDATYMDLTAAEIDYVHGNAIDMDTDGNLLISSRNLDEITKIDRSKGTIIWRMGGNNNEFTFTNDTAGFYRQHCIRSLGNGHVILFDNGNFHSPPYSRAVEYSLDEVNKTATQVWEYKNNPSIYSFAMGSVQRLPNGNTLIGWGFNATTLSEVTAAGDLILEMKFPTSLVSYRAFKFDWENPVSVSNINSNLPVEYRLEQNFPNPFNPMTSISFSIPKSGNVSIKVYDVMGREVAELFKGQKPAGAHSIAFDGSELSSGVYVYKITAGDYSATKKMVLMK